MGEPGVDDFLVGRIARVRRQIRRTWIVGVVASLGITWVGSYVGRYVRDPESAVTALPLHLDRRVRRVLKHRASAMAEPTARRLERQLVRVPSELAGVLRYDLERWGVRSARRVTAGFPQILDDAARADPEAFAAAVETFGNGGTLEPIRRYLEAHLSAPVAARFEDPGPGASSYLLSIESAVRALETGEGLSPEQELERTIIGLAVAALLGHDAGG